MRVVGYIRVSTQGQGDSGLGLEAQKEKIAAYCSLYDLELVSVFIDIASGKSLKGRDGLTQALAALDRGEASGLIVAKLDRLTRSVKDLGELIDKWFSRFSFFCVAEQVDTRTAAGRLVLNLLTSVAQWERETIGERTRAALAVKKNRGERVGYIPFGYRLAADGKTLEDDPQEQWILSEIKTLRRLGLSLRDIAAELNARGIYNREKKPWSHMAIKRVAKI